MVPIRTCVGCRVREEATGLVRLVVNDGHVVIAVASAGRGSWLHRRRTCLEEALRRGGIGRALHHDVSELDRAVLRAQFDEFEPTSTA